jgi:hypothetical protein
MRSKTSNVVTGENLAPILGDRISASAKQPREAADLW